MKQVLILAALFLISTGLLAQDWQWQNPKPTGNILYSVDFVDSENGWMVGEAGSIYHSSDGGTSWSVQVSGTTEQLWSVFFVDQGMGWVVGELGVILRTTDGGTFWTEQTSGTTSGLYSVHFVDSDNGWISGNSGTILHTTNGGAVWAMQQSNTDASLESIFFLDSNNGWTVGWQGVIRRTTNGGTSWTTQATGPQFDLTSVHFVDVNNGWAVGDQFDPPQSIIVHTTNGGTSWTYQSIGITTSLETIHFVDENRGWTAGASIYATTDAGATWTLQPGVPDLINSLHFSDPDSGWAVGRDGAVYHTSNGGVNWTAQSGNVAEVDLNSSYFITPDIGWIVGNVGTILHTTDGGTAWIRQTSGTGAGLEAIHFVDENTGWAVGGSTVLRTTNGGTTWTPQTSGGSLLNTVYFVDSENGWIGGISILHTTDGGASWTAQTTGTTTVYQSICFVDNNTGWAVGGGTIRHTTNGGTSWILQTGGGGLSVYFTDVNTGWIGGGSRTILHTTNAGSTWTVQSSGPGDDVFESIYFTDSKNGWAVGDEWVSKATLILHTTNGGVDWVDQVVAAAEIVYSAHFTDANTGWVTGAFGTILHTTTGGTGIEPPLLPSLLSPPNGSATGTNPLLGWNPSAGALWYSLQVSTSPYFIVKLVNQTDIAEASFQLSDLTENTTYYWRVSVTDATGTSNWSETWSFTTSTLTAESRVTPKSGGESLELGFRVTNDSDEDLTADIWVDLVNPNGASKAILLKPANEIPAGRTFNETKQIELRAGSVLGDYSFVVNVGTHPDEVLASTTAVYTKTDSGSARGQASMDVPEPLAREIPSDFSLAQNYPNPFNPSARIDFALPVESYVKLVIYDILGSEVVTLLNKVVPAGYSGIDWNATDASGRKVVSGVYMYRMTAADAQGQARFESLRKMILLR